LSSSAPSPTSVPISADGQWLYVGDRGPEPDGPGIICRIDPATMFGVETYADALLGRPIDLAAEASGDIYVVDSAAARIVKYTAAEATWSVWKTGLTSPEEIALSGDGCIYVRDGSSILKFNLATGDPVTPWSPAVTDPSGLAADSSGRVYVCDAPTHVVKRLSPDGSLEASCGAANGFGEFHATGLAVPPDGSAIYGAEADTCSAFAIRNSFMYRGVFDSAETEVTVTAINGADPAQFTGFDPEVRDAITARVRYVLSGQEKMMNTLTLEEPIDAIDSARFIGVITVNEYYGDDGGGYTCWHVAGSTRGETSRPTSQYTPFVLRVAPLPASALAQYSITMGTLSYQLQQAGDWSYLRAGSHPVFLYLCGQRLLVLATPNGSKGSLPVGDNDRAPAPQLEKEGSTAAQKDSPLQIENPLDAQNRPGEWQSPTDAPEPWFFAGSAYTNASKFRYKVDPKIPADASVCFEVRKRREAQQNDDLVHRQDNLPASHEWDDLAFMGLDEDGKQLAPGESYDAILIVSYKGAAMKTVKGFGVRSRYVVWYNPRPDNCTVGALVTALAAQANSHVTDEVYNDGLVLSEHGEWREAFSHMTRGGTMFSNDHGGPIEYEENGQITRSYGMIEIGAYPEFRRVAGFGDGTAQEGVLRGYPALEHLEPPSYSLADAGSVAAAGLGLPQA